MQFRKALAALAALVVALGLSASPAAAYSPYSSYSVTENGSTNIVQVPFPYINQSDVAVYVAGTLQPASSYTWVTASSIQLSQSASSLSGLAVVVKRTTAIAATDVTFQPGPLDNNDLNIVSAQLLYATQELWDQVLTGLAPIQVLVGYTPLSAAANLSDLVSASAARSNLGLSNVNLSPNTAANAALSNAPNASGGFLTDTPQAANTFLAGPASGANALPTYRTLTAADVPFVSGGFLNKLRNATLDIWQRGTSMTVSTSGQYAADGWFVAPTGHSVTVSQVAGRLLSVNAMKVLGASSNTDVQIKQPIESYLAAALAGQQVTLQFEFYNSLATSVTPTLTVKHPSAQDNYGSSVTDVSAASLQACPATSWCLESYSWTASASSALGMEVVADFGNNWGNASYYFEFAEADLRVTPNVPTGLVSAPPSPELRPYPSELVLDRTYFRTSYGNNVAPGTATHASMVAVFSEGTAGDGVGVNFDTPMRATPASSLWDGAGTANRASRYNTGWTDGAQLASIIASYPGGIQISMGAGGSTALFVHYQSSAEIAP